MTKLITSLLLLNLFVLTQAQATNLVVVFEKDQSSLTDSAKVKLVAFVHGFRKSKNRMDLRITGHTDSDGGTGYNEQLSLDRAQTVRLFLMVKGVKNRISLFSKGENQLLTKEQTKAAHQTNRRVVIEVQKSPNRLLNNFGTAIAQTHEVNTNQATELEGVKGTKIRFPKNSFKLPVGDSLVQITFREYTTKEDALLANLTTITPDGQLIESKGMVHIKATAKGKPVRLKGGKQVELFFTQRKEGDSTRVFYGQRFENGVTWTAGNKPAKCTTKISYQDLLHRGDVVSGYSETCRQDDGTTRISTYYNDGSLVKKIVLTGNDYDLGVPSMISDRLGWINCDRFANNSLEKIDFVVKLKNDSNLSVFLVFDDINSVMPYTYQKNDEYHFNNAPIGIKVTVVALHKAENQEKCYIARLPTSISNGFNETLIFKKVKKSDVNF
jgi:hypothetical protein